MGVAVTIRGDVVVVRSDVVVVKDDVVVVMGVVLTIRGDDVAILSVFHIFRVISTVPTQHCISVVGARDDAQDLDFVSNFAQEVFHSCTLSL